MRNLRFNSRGIKQLEEMFNTSALKYLKDMGNEETIFNKGIDEFITLLWLALIWEDKELTKDKCYDLYDIALEKNGFDEVLEKVINALSNYFGLSEEKQSIKNKTESVKAKKKTK